MRQLISILTLVFLFTACKKENNARDFKGTYTGTFIYSFNQSLNLRKTVSTDFKVTLMDQNFKVMEGTYLASGTFKVEDTKTITFADKNAWTADFDWNMILNGSYTYEAKGDSLILRKNIYRNPAANDIGQEYEYRLKRSK